MSWEQEWGRRKAIQATRTQMNTKISFSQVTKCLEWFWTLERIWSLVLCLWVKSRALVLNAICCKLGCLECWWLGVFIAPTTKTAVGEGCCRWAHASHVTQPLGFWRFRPLELWHLGAPDSPVPHRTATIQWPVRLWRLLWLLPWIVALLGHCAVDRCADSRCSAWCTGQFGDTPDSPVNYSGVRLVKLEGEEFDVDPPWCTGQSGAPDQGSLRFLLFLSFEP
jgi:hypothetical protein